MWNYEEYGFVAGATAVYCATCQFWLQCVNVWKHNQTLLHAFNLAKRVAHEIDSYLAAKGANNYLANLD